MNYFKFNSIQLNTLKNLPHNLNNSLINANIGGILSINKLNEIKQLIFDFETHNMDELFVNSKDSKVHLFKHIKNIDLNKYFTISLEINNIFKKQSDKEADIIYYSPYIYQWIKCVIFSIYRNIYNHFIITSSNNIYLISMKNTYFLNLFKKKTY